MQNPTLQNRVSHMSIVVFLQYRGALHVQSHVTLLPPPVTVFLLGLSVCIVCEAKLVGLCVYVCVC